ncbi:lipoyl(octanoyl) transferase LipB [Pseudohongiella sp.]|uniref:lipoyl(octanoyl) transferase n=1 Tax=marine sediment metagenome TaxID=412755 RepID=A0A0F9VK37_9ZZZZ|nr:lipoyl(octanoyl) transferase LipB [Pseudohongiella sp.]HDZ10323.1 lipoyl(octanoyl) transferase LipB [Pseudohongiella sp.]HEA62054.1 lipoyl(octanoyl) transferase LipB [Pseudohongiella sp.]
MTTNRPLIIRRMGLRDYEPVWRAMQTFTSERQDETPDELWVLSHLPVFTQGQAGKPEHLLAPGDIPVVQIDRGGQVTYHGPGQLVIYLLLDVRRAGLGVRELVSLIEQAIIDTLSAVRIEARTRSGAPGVYVDDAKIAALGLRIRRGCSYHGLSLNIAMDMEPFARINPCGYQGLAVTQVADFVKDTEPSEMMVTMEKILLQQLLPQLDQYSWIDVRQEFE